MLLFCRKKLIQLIALVCAVWILGPLANAATPDVVEQCNSCHGEDGVSAESDIPTIAGASAFVIEEYMFQYLEDARPCRESKYRSGDTERPATDMCAIAKDLNEDKISDIAEYYSGKEFVAAKQDFDAAKAEIGAKVHKRECEKCHSDGGSYADDDAGLLAGQWTPYLEQVFEEYVAGEREMMEDKMKEKIEGLDAESIDALLHFYASLQ
jgi:sulfide dehydrogenase cytochrome subunit